MATAARQRVAQALHGVFGEGRRIPDSWDRGLGPEDAGFAQALLGLALRRWGRLQAFAEARLKDPGRGVPLGTRVALGLGLAQLAWLEGVADHAAVSESVDLAADKTLGFAPHRGLVNAVLRKAAADRAKLRAELEALPPSLDRTPFVERVLDGALAPFGKAAEREALWAKLERPPRPTFRAVRPGPLPPGLEPDPELPGALRLAEGFPFPRPWLTEGRGMVQDRSSQALLRFKVQDEPKRIVDACAAPGGKATALALRFPGAQLFAVEHHAGRARMLERSLAEREVKAQVVVDDAAEWLAEGGKPFDLILLDAPCSGSGTLQKHPELIHLGGEVELPRLTGQQRRLLNACAARLAPGGLLVYAVCSWLPEEGEAHRAWIRQACPDLEPAPVWEGPGAAEGGTVFRPDPLAWEGEGFQGLAFRKKA